jgi:DNA-binding SARP family transcriptional activator
VLRIYLAGEPCLATDRSLIRADRLPGRQGRLAFVLLVSERARPVTRDELAEALWPQQPPAAYEVALSAIASKLRGLLGEAGLARGALQAVDGCYRIDLGPGSWVDTEAALEAVHAAEAALRLRRYREAYGPAVVAAAILRRPFLAGFEGGWIESRRQELRGLRLRALDVLAEVHLWNREPALALRAAEEAVTLEPYRESGYRRLMLIHLAAGDRAEARRVYERCRRLLADDLGEEPAPETRAVLAQLEDPVVSRPPAPA